MAVAAERERCCSPSTRSAVPLATPINSASKPSCACRPTVHHCGLLRVRWSTVSLATLSSALPSARRYRSCTTCAVATTSACYRSRFHSCQLRPLQRPRFESRKSASTKARVITAHVAPFWPTGRHCPCGQGSGPAMGLDFFSRNSLKLMTPTLCKVVISFVNQHEEFMAAPFLRDEHLWARPTSTPMNPSTRNPHAIYGHIRVAAIGNICVAATNSSRKPRRRVTDLIATSTRVNSTTPGS
jgi:hypothetical protein